MIQVCCDNLLCTLDSNLNSNQMCLRSEVTDLLTHIKELACSKYLHVQFAATRLFEILMKEPWQDYLFQKFMNNPDQYAQDLMYNESPFNVPSSNPEQLQDLMHIIASKQPAKQSTKQSLLSSTMLDIAIQALEQVKPDEPSRRRISFLMEEYFYHSLLGILIKNARHIDTNMVTISTLLMHLTKAFLRLGLVKARPDVKV